MWLARRDPRTDDSFYDLLPYASKVDPYTIACKNGSFIRCFSYRMRDADSATDEERLGDGHHLNAAFSQFLGSGWSLHAHVLRRLAPGYPDRQRSYFPDPVTAAIDEERRRTCEAHGSQYDQVFVLSLCYTPPSLAEQRLREWMFSSKTLEGASVDTVPALAEEALASFDRQCAAFVDRVAPVMDLVPLRTWDKVQEDGRTLMYDDQLAFLNELITGLQRPVVLPQTPVYLDHLLAGDDFWPGLNPKLGPHFIAVVSIDGLPMESQIGLLNGLAELAIPYVWNTRAIGMDRHEAVAERDKAQKKWEQKIRPLIDQVLNIDGGRRDLDAERMYADADEAMAEIHSGEVGGVSYTSNIILMDEDAHRLVQRTRDVSRAIHGLGFGARIETINGVEAWLGALPGNMACDLRKTPINTLNLTDLLPTSSLYTGDAKAPCPMYPPGSPALLQGITAGSVPFHYNHHVEDNGNSIVLGPIGSGKSTFNCACIAAELRYPGSTVFCFETGRSAEILTRAAGGHHYRLSADATELALAPLSELATADDIAWASGWIESCLALNGVNVTPAQRNEISQQLASMAHHGQRTLTHFRNLIQDPDIKEALKPYCIPEPLGTLLDAEADGLSLGRLVTFELEDLVQEGERFVVPVLLYLFRRIEKSLKGQPAFIHLDEAWQWLSHPTFRERIRRWLKEMRKRNCAVMMLTQSLSDLDRSGILDVIVESTATKIFLPNHFARDPDTSALYRRLGLNEAQIELLATAIPKRDYYATSKQGKRLFQLGLGPLALAFCGASDRKKVLQAEAIQRQFGDHWVREWLQLHHLNLEDYAHECR